MKSFTLNNYWGLGIVLILIYPFVLLAISLMFIEDDLSLSAQLVSIVFNLFYIAYFIFVFHLFYQDNLVAKRNGRNKIFIIVFSLLLFVFTYLNLQPDHFITSPFLPDSPFDKFYSHVTQYYYGFPDTYYRDIYERNIVIIHYDAIAFNLAVLGFFNFLVIGIFVIFDRIKTIKW